MSLKQRNRKSNTKHDFSDIPKAEIQRSRFDRSHNHKSTFDAGKLIPIYVDEALPGDTFNMSANVFARMATPIAPVMDTAKLTTHFYAVPYRLVWDNFQKFMGEQTNPGDSTDFLIPQIDFSGNPVEEQSIHDYMGIPLGYTGKANALHHRAYNLIYNEWYRDQNLIDSVAVPKDDGPDLPSTYKLLNRGKRHDYFTSCLPFPQKGTAVELPLGGTADINPTGSLVLKDTGGYSTLIKRSATAGNTAIFTVASGLSGSSFSYESGMEADLSTATAATINSIREAFQLQRMFEKDARGGTRYTEIVKSHFNVTSPDARLQRPEFLGGGGTNVTINPIADTTGSELGYLGAAGTVAGSGGSFNRSFTEHCLIIGVAVVTCDLTYQQGLNRQFSRRTRYDMYFPSLAHLGEQEVLNREIYADGSSTDEEVFGYQERYAEYRYFPSRISGKLRSTSATPLDVWHYAQKFETLPTLSEEFINENPPLDRVVAVPSEPHFIFDSYFSLKCDRPMPTYSVPGLIDHF